MTKHRIAAGAIALVLIAAFTPLAQAEDPVAPKAAESGSSMTAEEAAKAETARIEADARAKAEAQAKVKAELDALKASLEEKGSKVAPEARAKADRDIAKAQKELEASAAVDGDARIAERWSEETGMSAEAILAQKAALETSWGQLLVAHSLVANSGTDVTVEQLIQMKRDGMGWGKIAAGLDLQLGSVVSGIKAESQVARGLMKADGRVAAMTGPGARLGVGTGVGAGLGKGQTHVNSGVGVGVGVKTKP